jgi:hypothetical protein
VSDTVLGTGDKAMEHNKPPIHAGCIRGEIHDQIDNILIRSVGKKTELGKWTESNRVDISPLLMWEGRIPQKVNI